ncbi:MAG: hypothetical protein C0447_16215, partial [Methylobacterium sp.]|nr:hypothetical protein [Methylobacterium sp.]
MGLSGRRETPSPSALSALQLGLQGGELGEGRIRIGLAVGGAWPWRLLEALAAAVVAARAAATGATVALEIGPRAATLLRPAATFGARGLGALAVQTRSPRALAAALIAAGLALGTRGRCRRVAGRRLSGH